VAAAVAVVFAVVVAVVIAATAVLANAAPAATAAAQAGPAAAALASPGLFGWGEDNNGDLGNGTTGDYASPIAVALPAGVRQVSAGVNFSSAAVLSDGRVATWGHNDFGQLGDGTITDRYAPAVVPGLTGIIQVAAGEHMLALDSAGRVWSWGLNSDGELGNGTTSQVRGSNPTPVPVPGLTAVVQVALGKMTASRCAPTAPSGRGASTTPASSAMAPTSNATCQFGYPACPASPRSRPARRPPTRSAPTGRPWRGATTSRGSSATGPRAGSRSGP
jgi:hypothetical protein